MSSVTQSIVEKGLVKPPSWLASNVHYEAITGSIAYGVSEDTSDFDVYGWCIPPKDMIFPHLRGEIPGFGRQVQRFEQFQQHHVNDPEALGGKGRQYDLSIYSIVKWFHLVMEGNPNMVDALFVPANCVLRATQIGQRVRERRKLFLHKGCWHKYKGYAFAQASRMRGDRKRPDGKRKEVVDQFGFDCKHAYHIVRLLDEAEQILETGDLVLGRNREHMKAIRRGEWTEQQVLDHFAAKEKALEELYQRSTLPWGPDEDAIKGLLLECLEEHFGSLAAVVAREDAPVRALREIDGVLAGVRGLL